MSKADTIYAAFIVAVLLILWGLWFRANSAQVEACFNNYEACTTAYYQNNK